jgi:hypothetical protein
LRPGSPGQQLSPQRYVDHSSSLALSLSWSLCAISFQFHETNLAFYPLDRPLTHINKKGRPVSQCSHCRGLRKSRTTHVKCECGDKKKKTDSSDSHCDKRDLKRELIMLWRCRPRFPHSDLNLQRTPFTAVAVARASAASVR